MDCAAENGDFGDGPRRGRWPGGHSDHPGPVPPLPPIPPLPPAPPWYPQDRVGQVLQRFELFRERAEAMVSRAEQILNLGREEFSRPAQAHPGQADPGQADSG